MASERMARVECEGVRVCLLLVLAVLHHTVNAGEKMLDMAPDAVDDDFSDCRDKMLKVVKDELLQKELTAEKEFKEMWSKISKTCSKIIPGGTSLHTDALQAYGNSKTAFRKKFNDLVYSSGNSNMTYREKFNFKSLHFLLTDSLRLLKPEKCSLVFYGTNNVYKATQGTEVRFGKFIRPTFSKHSAVENIDGDEDEEGSLFIINSCSVVHVERNTCKSEEIEGLISPAEVFTVEKVEGSEYRKITLNHSRFLSSHHCSFFPRNATDVKSSSSLTLTLLVLLACLWSQAAGLTCSFL